MCYVLLFPLERSKRAPDLLAQILKCRHEKRDDRLSQLLAIEVMRLCDLGLDEAVALEQAACLGERVRWLMAAAPLHGNSASR